jgi:hypothetical protein
MWLAERMLVNLFPTTELYTRVVLASGIQRRVVQATFCNTGFLLGLVFEP